ncbi:hypothetical protein [Methylobacterium tarhaniae]|uniref:hypothetical protein n=1 Tax=Methylobacterium tarhaniae TaxID=1187852 RepID=UPI003D0530F2
MTEEEIKNAAACYSYMRKRLVAESPVGTDGKTIREHCDGLVERSIAASEADAHTIWETLYPLPFYSAMKIEFASRRVQSALKGGWLSDFRMLAGAESSTNHPWHVARQNNRYVAIGSEAREFCSRSGRYEGMSLKTNPFVIQRLSRLATIFEVELRKSPNSTEPFLNILAGKDIKDRESWALAHAKLESAIGPITAAHAMTDCGFRMVKPDIWITRIATRCGWIKTHTDAQLANNRHGGWQVLFDTCHEIASYASAEFPSKNPLREFDFYVANYGMRYRPDTAPVFEANPSLIAA